MRDYTFFREPYIELATIFSNVELNKDENAEANSQLD